MVAKPSTGVPPRVVRAKLRRPAPDQAATVLYALVAAIAYVYLMWKTRGNTFFYDEWGWLFRRRTGVNSVLGSYNSQMMLVTSAAYQLLWRTVGLTHYWVWRAIGIAVHIGLVSTVFVYVRRRVSAAVGLLLCLPLLFLGYGFEDVLWPINAGFVATLALGIWSLMALERSKAWSSAAACGLLVLALACSELALVFALAVAVELTWRDRSLRRWWVWLTPLILYAIWWAAYYQPSTTGSGLTGMPSFAASMAAAAIAGLFGLDPTWGQSLLVAAVILGLWRFSRRGVFNPRAAGLVVLACSYWLLVAYGRDANPNAARYVYVGAVLLVLIGAEAVRMVRIRPGALAIGALVALFALAGNLHYLNNGEGELRAGSQTSRAELGALELIRHTVSQALLIDQHYMPGMTAGQYFAATRAFGGTPADTPAQILREPELAREAADGLMLRGGAVQVHPLTRGTSLHAASQPAVELSAGGRLARHGGCLSFTPLAGPGTLQLRLTNGIELINGSSAPVGVLIRRFASHFGATPLPDLAGHRTTMISARQDSDPLPWSLRISPARRLTVCAAT